MNSKINKWTVETATWSAALRDVYDEDGNRLAEHKIPEVAHLIAAAPELLVACKLALIELDRIGSDIGFEPDRYQERINALDALSRATRKAVSNG